VTIEDENIPRLLLDDLGGSVIPEGMETVAKDG
jgi:hypothetical protein